MWPRCTTPSYDHEVMVTCLANRFGFVSEKTVHAENRAKNSVSMKAISSLTASLERVQCCEDATTRRLPLFFRHVAPAASRPIPMHLQTFRRVTARPFHARRGKILEAPLRSVAMGAHGEEFCPMTSRPRMVLDRKTCCRSLPAHLPM